MADARKRKLSVRVPHETEWSDEIIPIKRLKILARQFVEERDWTTYHTPKNVAISLVLEASELLEHFQWFDHSPKELSADQKKRVGEEMADVLAYLLSLSHILNIDLSQAMHKKMIKNAEKYPVEQFKGTYRKVKS